MKQEILYHFSRRLNVDENNKKIAAAISAVTKYIQQEEEIIYTQPCPAAAHAPSVKLRLWGLSGRQAQMQMRNLMQMKAFHGSKFMK
jgi:hypothetical protein